MQLPLQLAVASLMDIDALEALDPELIDPVLDPALDPALDLVSIEARALNYPATYQTYHHQID
jgi:hypothetical protein